MFFLQLKNELWKLFGKKRTYIGSGMILLAQVALVLLFRYGKAATSIRREIERSGVPVDHYLTNLTIAAVALVPIGYVLLPLYASLVGGDLVAKEAEDGTLRMILSRPASRLRLLLVKWCAGVVFSFALVLTLCIFGAAFPWLFYHTGAMFIVEPPAGILSVFEGAAAWQRFVAVHLVMVVEVCSIMSMAFMFSCFDIKPAAATVLAISFFFIFFILDTIPYLQDYKDWFLVQHLYVWNNFFKQPIPWWRVGESLSILAGYNLTFLIVGCSAFQVRDIKS